MPALLEGRDLVRVFPPRAARVVAVKAGQGQALDAGAAIVQLDSPELAFEAAALKARLRSVGMRLDRLGADDQDRDDKLVLDGEYAALTHRLKSLAEERAQLDVRTPIAGVLIEIDPDLHAGRWLKAKEPIALVSGSAAAKVSGYVSENDIGRIGFGAAGRFIPDDPEVAAVEVELEAVAMSGTPALEIAELASPNGGRIAVQADARQKLVPTTAQFLATFRMAASVTAPRMAMRGVVHLTGSPESLLARTWRRVLKVLMQEGGA